MQWSPTHTTHNPTHAIAKRNKEQPGWYAKVLASLHLLLDTHSYFLHGPLTALGETFCTDITNRIATLAPSLQNKPIRLLRSQLGDDAGALGAASLAMEKWVP